MKKEYEGLDFSRVTPLGKTLIRYTISDDGTHGYFLLQSRAKVYGQPLLILRWVKARSLALINGYHITSPDYWNSTNATDINLLESELRDIFGDPDYKDSTSLGQVIAKFIVGGGNP